MNIKAGFFLIFSFLFCVSIVIETRGFAEDLEIYTLEKSISEALEKNWTVKAVEATVQREFGCDSGIGLPFSSSLP